MPLWLPSNQAAGETRQGTFFFLFSVFLQHPVLTSALLPPWNVNISTEPKMINNKALFSGNRCCSQEGLHWLNTESSFDSIRLLRHVCVIIRTNDPDDWDPRHAVFGSCCAGCMLKAFRPSGLLSQHKKLAHPTSFPNAAIPWSHESGAKVRRFRKISEFLLSFQPTDVPLTYFLCKRFVRDLPTAQTSLMNNWANGEALMNYPTSLGVAYLPCWPRVFVPPGPGSSNGNRLTCRADRHAKKQPVWVLVTFAENLI